MLDSRIYRAALVPILLAVIVCAFSLQDRPRPIGTTLAPDAFSESLAVANLEALAHAYPARRPGDSGDEALAAALADQFRRLRSYQVSQRTFTGETADGERQLTTVTARQVGQPGPGLVIVAHRDALGRGAKAELSGTAAMMELARIVSGGQLRRTVTFVSLSGGSAGAAGARDFAAHLGGSPDAVLVLGSMAGQTVRRPFVTAWADGGGTAPLRLRRTVEAAVRREAGTNPGGARARSQWVRLATGLTTGEQGPLVAAGLPAVQVSVSGERPPPARDPIVAGRMQAFGRGALRALTALDNAPDLPTGTSQDLTTMRKVLPEWAARLLVGSLLLAPLIVSVDGFARARRRRAPVLPWLGWIAAVAFVGLAGAIFVWLLGLTGLLPATPPAPAPPGAIPLRGGGEAALAAIVLVGVLAALVARPAIARAAGVPGRIEGSGAGAALLLCWSALSVLAWVVNPYLAAILVPGAHLLLPLVAPGVRLRRAVALLLVVLSALPIALLLAGLADLLGFGVLDACWAVVLWVAGGVVGPLGWLFWSVLAACLLAALLLALRPAAPAPERRVPERQSVRGPAGYAGPGSLGGTKSALR
ncbi:MAG: M28 family peptidase [Solirubrobacteraceae bacterium]